MSYHEKLCPQCKQWTDTSTKVCAHCGGRLFEQEERERAVRKQQASTIQAMVIPIHDSDHALVKVLKRGIQFLQLAYFGLVSFVVWFVTWVVG